MKKDNLFSKKFAAAVACLITAAFLSACGEEGPVGASSASSTSHNAGTDCRSCHSLAYAGTIYSSLNSSSATAGATITITEASGKVITMVSDRAGNFYSSSGSPSAGYSVSVQGNTLQMTANPTQGGCNTGGCHDGRTQPRIYVR